MSRKVKEISLILSSITIVVLTIIGLGRDLFHAVEEIFYDHESTLFSSSAFSRLTNKVVVFSAVLSLFLIPYYFLQLFEDEKHLPQIVYSMKFICSCFLTVVFVLVLFVFFPLNCVLQGFEDGFRSTFLGDCLYSHILIPILFVCSFFAIDERQKISKKAPLLIILILGVYVLVYILFVFILKTWEDFYYISEATKTVTYFAIIPLCIIVLIGVYFGTTLLLKAVSKEHDETVNLRKKSQK